MKVMVFGGAGFLGSHVADALTASGHEVSVFDLHQSRYLRASQKMVLGDILDAEKVMRAVQGFDCVYDFAGLANLDSAATKPIDTIMLNIVGTCNILNACVKHGVKRFIYASSFYANSDKGGFYRCSKQAAELYIEEYMRKYRLLYTILRYGSLYGTRAGKENGICNMLRSAMSSGKICYPGSGDEIREYIHVVDAAALSVQILENEYANKHIVLTGHDSYCVRDLIKIIEEILNRELEVVYENKSTELHYLISPYTYRPKENYKLVSNLYHDIGQGLIEVLEEIDGCVSIDREKAR